MGQRRRLGGLSDVESLLSRNPKRETEHIRAAYKDQALNGIMLVLKQPTVVVPSLFPPNAGWPTGLEVQHAPTETKTRKSLAPLQE